MNSSFTTNFTLNTTSEDDITVEVVQGSDPLMDESTASSANTPQSVSTTAVDDTNYVDVMINGLEDASEYVTLTGFNDDLGTVYSRLERQTWGFCEGTAQHQCC